MLTPADIQAMADLIAVRFQPEKIILFGSYATGTATADSDVDLLVVKDSVLPRHQRSAPIYKALFGTGNAVDIMVYTPGEIEEWRDVPQAFVSTALNQGRVLYENQA
ncbi:MAG: nucleotidyltransferase domain-containing protein [bacterium]